MGDRPGKLKFMGACAAAIAGAVLAAAVASAQGPGDYQPTTTLPNPTTLPAPPGDGRVEFGAEAKAGPLRGKVKVKVVCEESCTAEAGGRIRLSGLPGKGKSSKSYRLGSDRDTIAAGDTTLKLKVPKGARKKANSNSFEGRTRAKVTVEATDAAGNSGREQLRLKFRTRN